MNVPRAARRLLSGGASAAVSAFSRASCVTHHGAPHHGGVMAASAGSISTMTWQYNHVQESMRNFQAKHTSVPCRQVIESPRRGCCCEETRDPLCVHVTFEARKPHNFPTPQIILVQNATCKLVIEEPKRRSRTTSNKNPRLIKTTTR